LTDLEQRRIAFHHTNLQPLWASDKLGKGWTLRRSGDDASQGRTRIRVKCWEIIADNLSKAGWSWGYVSALDSEGRTIWIADAHRGDGKRFVVRADEKLTAFMELQAATRAFSESH